MYATRSASAVTIVAPDRDVVHNWIGVSDAQRKGFVDQDRRRRWRGQRQGAGSGRLAGEEGASCGIGRPARGGKCTVGSAEKSAGCHGKRKAYRERRRSRCREGTQ